MAIHAWAKKSLDLLLPGGERCVDGAAEKGRAQTAELGNLAAGDGVAAVAGLKRQRVVGKIDGLAAEVEQHERSIEFANRSVERCAT